MEKRSVPKKGQSSKSKKTKSLTPKEQLVQDQGSIDPPKDSATGTATPVPDGPLLRNRIQVQFDIEYGGTPGMDYNNDSQTVPDLNLTVRQLLQNHTRGHNGQINVREPVYFDMVVPNITDLTDVDAYKKQLDDELARVNQFIEEDKKLQQEEKLKEEAEKRQKQKDQEDLERGRQLRIDEEAERKSS